MHTNNIVNLYLQFVELLDDLNEILSLKYHNRQSLMASLCGCVRILKRSF